MNAFSYSNSDKYNSYPYVGLISTYLGGGYVFEMQWDEFDEIYNNLTFLQVSNWIDRQTRAVFIEFNLYNPNVNLYSYCFILFEILPTGGLIATSNFAPIKLSSIQRPKDVFSTENLLFFSFLMLIMLFMVHQFMKMIKLGKEFFKMVYSYVNVAIIGLSWAGFAMTVLKIIEMNKVYTDFHRTNEIFINLQYTAELNDLIANMFAVCTMLCTLRLVNLIKFSKVIKILMQTLASAFRELTYFGIYFVVFWFCFIQVIYILLHQVSNQFSTIVRTMETCFQMLLGKFQINDILNGDKTFGPVVFVLYNIIVSFILVCIFLTILMEHYADACKNPNFDEDELELYRYFKEIIDRYFSFVRKEHDDGLVGEYVSETYLGLERTVERLLEKVSNENKTKDRIKKESYFKIKET